MEHSDVVDTKRVRMAPVLQIDAESTGHETPRSDPSEYTQPGQVKISGTLGADTPSPGPGTPLTAEGVSQGTGVKAVDYNTLGVDYNSLDLRVSQTVSGVSQSDGRHFKRSLDVDSIEIVCEGDDVLQSPVSSVMFLDESGMGGSTRRNDHVVLHETNSCDF